MHGTRGQQAGTLLAGGWCGGFKSSTADWKERALSHCFLQRNYQSMQLCDQCAAIKPFPRTPQRLLPFIYTDFRMNAPWTETIRDHAKYLEETPRANLTPWLAVPGFNICRVKFDSAHTILLGAGKDLAASYLFDLAPRTK